MTTTDWEDIRTQLSQSLAEIQAIRSSATVSSVSLTSSLADALLALDSSLESGIGNDLDPSFQHNAKKEGRLQKVERLQKFYFGDSSTEGFFARLEKLLDASE